MPLNYEDQLPDPMSERERRMVQVAILKESISLDWVQMAEAAMDREERKELRKQISAFVTDLSEIFARLEKLDADGS